MTNPRQRRLQTDHEKVQALVAGSGGTLKLISLTGNPPTRYVIEYHCPSIIQNPLISSNFLGNTHQVEINLGMNYPFEKPTARMLTPVFNPHVFSSNSICLGNNWVPGETLDVLIERIGALLQYDLRVLDFRSPANGEANHWAQANRARLPIGRVTFKAAQSGKKGIEWH